MASVNWPDIRTKYITSIDPISYEKLAEEYGCNITTIAVRAGEEKWVDLRQEAQKKIKEITIEKAVDKIANFQAEKLKVGKFMIGKGVEGITAHAPRNARESKELVEAGYKIATESLGLDKPNTQVNIQNNIFTVSDLVREMQEKRKQRQTDGQ